MNGILFDIQRFSVHDGPGIRTTVFFKGCPLRCRWCHNPEGLLPRPQLQYFEEKCIKCGRCGDRASLSDAHSCPTGALKVCGFTADEDAVMAQVIKDTVFYAEDGGLTLSGGECLLQADFVSSLLTRAKALGIHTAVDTCGYVPWSEIEKTLEVCDLYLYDVKCVTSSRHKEYTGVDNSLILENLTRLSEAGKDIWIRIPLIPDFNDTAEEMERIARLVASLPSVRRVTLMPYHSLGASKYGTLGLEYRYDTSKKLPEDKLSAFTSIFKSHGINIE